MNSTNCSKCGVEFMYIGDSEHPPTMCPECEHGESHPANYEYDVAIAKTSGQSYVLGRKKQEASSPADSGQA